MQKTMARFGRAAFFAGSMIGLLAITQPARATDLPAVNCGFGPTNTCLQFDDATVFSLPLLQFYQTSGTAEQQASLAGFNLLAQPNDAFLYIENTNAQGTTIQGNGTAIDDPFDALSGTGQSGNNLRYLYATALYTGQQAVPSDPAGGPSNDGVLQSQTTVVNSGTYGTQSFFNANDFTSPCTQTSLNGCLPLWDASVVSLRTALLGDPTTTADDSDLVFFFNFNETGTNDLLGQDQDAWARIYLVRADGTFVSFTLSGNNTALPQVQSDPQIANESDILPTASDLWAHVHSELCVQDGTGQVFLGTCANAGVTGSTVDLSLGANEADFAIFNAQLNALVKDPNSGFVSMVVDTRGAFENDGGNIFWIGPAHVLPPQVLVPEPGTLIMLGTGLAAIGLLYRRRRR